MPAQNKFSLSYAHHVEKPSFFKPRVMEFKEENQVFFLSPFKIIVFTRIYGSGFPYSSNFHHTSMWEYE